MRNLLRSLGVLGTALALAWPLSADAQETRVVSGVVVDAQSGAPVSDAVVTIQGTPLSALTDPDGRFELSGVPVGEVRLVLRHVAYGEHAQPLTVAAMGPLDFQIRLSTQAIELAPLDVEITSPETQARRASGTATNIIDRATIDAFPPGGRGLLPLLEGRIPSLRVHGDCVEYRYLQQAVVVDPRNPEWMTTTPCRDITVYVDGVPGSQGSALLQQLLPQDVEQIQVLSPSEAGLQYMAAGRGVILVETRRGIVAETPDRVHVNGFGWDEPQSYPLWRTLGLSALGSAAVAGIASRTVFDCDDRDAFVTPVRCQAPASVAGAVLTSAVGRMITHRAGRTSYTEGRTFPALLMGAATASIGYALHLQGEKQDSDASRAAGQIILAVGLPLTLTLSDRLFRMLR